MKKYHVIEKVEISDEYLFGRKSHKIEAKSTKGVIEKCNEQNIKIHEIYRIDKGNWCNSTGDYHYTSTKLKIQCCYQRRNSHTCKFTFTTST